MDKEISSLRGLDANSNCRPGLRPVSHSHPHVLRRNVLTTYFPFRSADVIGRYRPIPSTGNRRTPSTYDIHRGTTVPSAECSDSHYSCAMAHHTDLDRYTSVTDMNPPSLQCPLPSTATTGKCTEPKSVVQQVYHHPIHSDQPAPAFTPGVDQSPNGPTVQMSPAARRFKHGAKTPRTWRGDVNSRQVCSEFVGKTCTKSSRPPLVSAFDEGDNTASITSRVVHPSPDVVSLVGRSDLTVESPSSKDFPVVRKSSSEGSCSDLLETSCGPWSVEATKRSSFSTLPSRSSSSFHDIIQPPAPPNTPRNLHELFRAIKPGVSCAAPEALAVAVRAMSRIPQHPPLPGEERGSALREATSFEDEETFSVRADKLSEGRPLQKPLGHKRTSGDPAFFEMFCSFIVIVFGGALVGAVVSYYIYSGVSSGML